MVNSKYLSQLTLLWHPQTIIIQKEQAMNNVQTKLFKSRRCGVSQYATIFGLL